MGLFGLLLYGNRACVSVCKSDCKLLTLATQIQRVDWDYKGLLYEIFFFLFCDINESGFGCLFGFHGQHGDTAA